MTSHLDLLPEATKASFSGIRDLLLATLDNLESFRIPVFRFSNSLVSRSNSIC